MEFEKAKCNQCGHRWLPHVDHPQKCPNCQRKDWNGAKRKTRLYSFNSNPGRKPVKAS